MRSIASICTISMAHYLLRFVFLARPSFCYNLLLQEFSEKKLGQTHLIVSIQCKRQEDACRCWEDKGWSR